MRSNDKIAEEKINNALKSKRIPIVTLDNKWHKIWTMIEKPSSISQNEKKLNELLKRQGRIGSEIKDIKKIKKKLMDEIVTLMDNEGSNNDMKAEENKRLIEECNEKIDAYNDELMDIPHQIDEINRSLMNETVDLCYEALHINEDDIESLANWVNDIRVELKKNVVRKQELEIQNAIMYSYMHDVFGADVIELFDMKYNPLEKMIKLKAIKDEQKNSSNGDANNKAEDADKRSDV